MAGPHPQSFHSVGLGRSLWICISHKFPGEDAAAGLGTSLCLTTSSTFGSLKMLIRSDSVGGEMFDKEVVEMSVLMGMVAKVL